MRNTEEAGQGMRSSGERPWNKAGMCPGINSWVNYAPIADCSVRNLGDHRPATGGAYVAHFGRRGDYATFEDRTHGKKRPCVRQPETLTNAPAGLHQPFPKLRQRPKGNPRFGGSRSGASETHFSENKATKLLKTQRSVPQSDKTIPMPDTLKRAGN
jgi:hypothetical protein